MSTVLEIIAFKFLLCHRLLENGHANVGPWYNLCSNKDKPCQSFMTVHRLTNTPISFKVKSVGHNLGDKQDWKSKKKCILKLYI